MAERDFHVCAQFEVLEAGMVRGNPGSAAVAFEGIQEFAYFVYVVTGHFDSFGYGEEVFRLGFQDVREAWIYLVASPVAGSLQNTVP